MSIHNRGYWLDKAETNTHASDPVLKEALVKVFSDVKTIIDIGCGNGEYTKHFIQHGFECSGYDGCPITPEITNGVCKVQDFSVPVNLGTFDLVLSLEVGEHVPQQYEQIFIDNLVSHSTKYICISWGVEGQPGIGHVNCRNNDYIIEEMSKRDYEFDLKKSAILRKYSTFPWFENTVMVFYKVQRKSALSIFEGYEKSLVSVVLTACGRLDLLRRTIDSFNKYNTFPINQFIIVDDSGDKKVHKELRKSYPDYTLVLNESNIGLIDSIDRGYSKVQTPYIFHCFKADTIVETINGAEKIRSIKVGDLVKTHTGEFCPVVNTFKHRIKDNSPLIWVKTNFSTIKCTPEHPFLTLRDNKINWIEASRLTIFDLLLYPIENKLDYIDFNCKDRWHNWDKVKVDKDLARFMGLYLAEGSVIKNSSIRFCFNNNETELHDFIINVCKNRFKRKPTVHKAWATTILLNIRSFSHIFPKWFGDNAKNKKIPDFVFGWNLTNKLNFIYGYILGDGYIPNTGAVIVSASSQLIKDYIKICNSCGLSISKVEVRKPRTVEYNGKLIKGNGSFAARMFLDSWRKFLDLLNAQTYKNYFTININSIEQKKHCFAKNSESHINHVYNLEVKNNNTYIANSVIVHNCEEDWEFYRPGFIEKSLEILLCEPAIMMVWIRALNDTNGHPIEPKVYKANHVNYQLVACGVQGMWHGWTFNPGLRRLSDYQKVGKYGKIAPWEKAGTRECLVGIEYFRLGLRSAILPEGYVYHTGGGYKSWSLA